MREYNFKIIVISISLLLTNHLKGQGCSDAGVCSINSYKPNVSDSSNIQMNSLKIGLSYGSADKSISVIGNYIDYNRQFNEKIGVNLKITSLSQSGNDISAFGISDIFLNSDYKINDNLRITLGTKIPLSKSNKQLNNLPLPMDYQASMGTLDFLLGIGFKVSSIQFVIGLQQPLIQNKNEFLADNYPINSNLKKFQSTNNFKRSGDVLLRVSYPIKLNDKFRITPSVLPIYHLTNDKFSDELNVEQEIKGSRGLTLNSNIFFDFEINKNNAIQLNAGIPFIVRDSRPDGLTRSFIANIEYRILF